jgi:gamma-glutamyl:cysteine ligase YbdK (ATP-grasp superfamily)
MWPLKVLGGGFVVALIEEVRDPLTVIVSLLGIAAIAGAVFSYNRQKVALSSAESASKAWKDERDAALAHAERETSEKVAAIAKATALQARPDLTTLEDSIQHLIRVTERHEANAASRVKLVVAAIEGLNTRGKETR